MSICDSAATDSAPAGSAMMPSLWYRSSIAVQMAPSSTCVTTTDPRPSWPAPTVTEACEATVAPSDDTFAEDRCGLDHLSFTVDTRAALEDAVKTLDELGIAHEGIKDAGPGLSIVEFRDPDNIALGSDGLVWVTVASPTDLALTVLQRSPRPVRQLVRRLPERLKPAPKRTARVLALDSTGRTVHDLDFDATAWHFATGVREHHGRVWLGSLVEPAIAVGEVPEPP